MHKVFFHNSFSGEKEEFIPKDPKSVSIYSCGPTVYNFAHIGNLRSFMFTDVLRRSLKILGYSLNQTMNITDIDDKIIKNSIEKNIPIEEFTKPWTEAFFQDLETLKIEKLEHYPRATDSIDDMLIILDRLKENGFVYEKDDSIYFRLSKFSNYGKLSRLDTSGLKSGARYDSDEYDKDDARDFVLWKNQKLENEKSWDTRHGKGRPGWHLECSAMIRQIYSSGIDIHTGGIDLLFPHHENEIAQSEGAYPGEKFVNYWLHCEHLLVDGQKMSKSLGNFYTLRDLLEKGFKPNPLRYLLLSFHYRSKLNFSLSRIEESEKALQRIQTALERVLEKTDWMYDSEIPKGYSVSFYNEFLAGLADDLNVPKSLSSVFEFVKHMNADLDSEKLGREECLDSVRFLFQVNRLLDVLEFSKKDGSADEEIDRLVAARIEARKNKDFKKADEIRDELNRLGIILEDTKTGVKWKRK
ncbi:MAG TPA: cysteine--tRNA ligase [Leptospiraceae bacterium]|nr:cysteine--tRNA ligase [Leptospiraceae bacterium]